jgi:hypothetical protein
MGDRISNTWADIVNKVNKNVSWSQQADMWSTLQKIGGLILSTYNLAMGSAIYTSGSPVLGSTLIAAGLLSTANIAITEMGGWSYLAEKLSQDNKKLQEQIAFWAPMTLYALSATTSITAAYDPTLLTQIPSLEWKNYLDNMEPVLIAGKGAANAGLEWTQSSLLSLQTALFTDNLARDVLTSWIQKFIETLESGWEQARNIVSITTQMKV